MKTPSIEYYDRAHPHDLIVRAISKIDTLSAFITVQHEDSPCEMTETVSNGLYFSFLNITQELELALNKLQEARP